MLPKKERLSRDAFNRFFSLGRRVHSKNFTIVYSSHAGLNVSVVTSKKVSPSAVIRNKVRRRIYDSMRHCRDEYHVGGVYIFLTKAGIAKVSYALLREEIYEQVRTIMKK